MISEAGFLSFIRGTVGICASDLADTSPAIHEAYCFAVETVNPLICQAAPHQYALAVYNLGADYLLNWAPDATGSTFFSDYRKLNKLNSFVPGVIASTSDEGTAESLVVPEAFKDLQFSDLQELKTPYGRFYLSIAQKFGPLWGLS